MESVPIIGLTMQEAADALRIDVKTMRRLIREGEIPARKVGKGWRIHPDAITDWLKAGRDTLPDTEQE